MRDGAHPAEIADRLTEANKRAILSAVAGESGEYFIPGGPDAKGYHGLPSLGVAFSRGDNQRIPGSRGRLTDPLDLAVHQILIDRARKETGDG